MTRLTLFLLATTFLLLGHSSNGQTDTNAKDTLVFQKIKNINKKLGLPLNDYAVLLKPTIGRGKHVIITDYTDSTLILKVYSFKKDERKVKRAAIAKIIQDSILTNSQTDSLIKLVMYSTYDTINLSQVDKIIIANANRPDKKWLVNTSNWAAAGWALTFIPVILITKSIPVTMVMLGAGLAVSAFSIIVENKTIKMDKWKLTPRQL